MMSDDPAVRIPKFSVVLPVFDPPLKLLKRSLKSVRRQTYGDWELTIVNDASRNRQVATVLARFARRDPRIKIRTHAVNSGITAATRSAIESSFGEFIVFLDHDDELHPNALAAVKEELDHDDNVDFVYSDEEVFSTDGHRSTVYKPDYSYVRLLSQNYIGHLVAIRRQHLIDCGGIRDGFNGAQDYDLCLRAATSARKIAHVREPLYRWNLHSASFSRSSLTSSGVEDSGQRALQEHLRKCVSEQILVRRSQVAGCFEFDVQISVEDDIELTTVGYELVGQGSITARDHQIIDFEAMSDSIRSLDQLIRHSAKPFVAVAAINLSAISVEAMGEIGKYLKIDNVGLVAPAFVTRDKVLVSSGNFHRAGRIVRAGFGISSEDAAVLGPLEIPREVSSVGWEFFVVSRQEYLRVGGFAVDVDPRLALIDLSLRMKRVGISTVVNPHIKIEVSDHCEELVANCVEGDVANKWGTDVIDDPFDWVPN